MGGRGGGVGVIVSIQNLGDAVHHRREIMAAGASQTTRKQRDHISSRHKKLRNRKWARL